MISLVVNRFRTGQFFGENKPYQIAALVISLLSICGAVCAAYCGLNMHHFKHIVWVAGTTELIALAMLNKCSKNPNTKSCPPNISIQEEGKNVDPVHFLNKIIAEARCVVTTGKVLEAGAEAFDRLNRPESEIESHRKAYNKAAYAFMHIIAEMPNYPVKLVLGSDNRILLVIGEDKEAIIYDPLQDKTISHDSTPKQDWITWKDGMMSNHYETVIAN